MIRHEAVRKKCEALSSSSVPKVRHRSVDHVGTDERATSVEGAEGKEILSETDVRKALEAMETRHGAHDGRKVGACPSYAGAEAPPYESCYGLASCMKTLTRRALT